MMKKPAVALGLSDIRALAPRRSALTLGVFDGVHLGHRQIVSELVQMKRRSTIDTCFVVTFDPHPLVVTHSKMTPPMLTTIDERIALLGEFDIDGVVVLKFDEELANVDYRAFLENYLLKPFDMKLLVLGYDCYFGRDREGSPQKAEQEGARLGFDVKLVSARSEGDEIVSSTRIRNALMEGNVDRANRLLGHPYMLSGVVVHGQGKGNELGFPTANLSIDDPHKLWPPRGVYAVQVVWGSKTLSGMMNIGIAPTVKSSKTDAADVEVHLFDFDGDLYGERLSVYCHTYLRAEKRFPSIDALIEQLETDRLQAVASLKGEA